MRLNTQSGRELARRTTLRITGREPDTLDPRMGIGGPIVTGPSGTSQPQNFVQSSDSLGLRLDEITQWFRGNMDEDHRDMVAAVQKFIEATVRTWHDSPKAKHDRSMALDDWTPQMVYNYALYVAGRWPKGIIGEVFVEQVVLAGDVGEMKDSDEANGIDERLGDMTFSVKTTQNIGDERFDKKNADIGIVVEVDDSYEPIGWMYRDFRDE
jgi:hypothetical protein